MQSTAAAPRTEWETHRGFIEHLVENGGPHERDYPALEAFVHEFHRAVLERRVTAEELASVRGWFGPALSVGTMLGFSLRKPHGYAGDFEIIDRIYQRHVSPDPRLAKWDHFYHRQAAPRAVRNRKTYFHTLLDRHQERAKPLRVLKIASGPGRSMFEWLTAHPDAAASFHCIEIDPLAIRHAAELNRPFLDRVTFEERNALRFHPKGTYDLIWAAGIFDYFSDSLFVALLRRLAGAIAAGGEIVIGNFATGNPSRAYMELIGDWHLHHRSRGELCALAAQAGVAPERIRIGSEPEQVNLFLHVAAADAVPERGAEGTR